MDRERTKNRCEWEGCGTDSGTVLREDKQKDTSWQDQEAHACGRGAPTEAG